MPEQDYIKIPQKRVGVLIGKKGNVKKSIEKATKTTIDIESDTGMVIVNPNENMEDPLGVWTALDIIKAIGRGFNPELALTLINDEIYLEIIKLPLFVGKSKKALTRHKGRIIGKEGKTREIITEMADVHMSIYGKTVSFIGKLENVIVAKEAVEMLLRGSRYKSVYGFLENKKHERKLKEFKNLVGIETEEKIEFRDDFEIDEDKLNFD